MGKGERRGRAGRRRVGGGRRFVHHNRGHGGGGGVFSVNAGAGQLSRTQRIQRQVGLLTFMLLIPGIALTVIFCCDTEGPAIAGYCCLGFAGFLMIVTCVLSHKAREEARNNATTTQAQQVGGVTVQSDGSTMHGLTVVGLQLQQQHQQNPQLLQMFSALSQQMQDPQYRQTVQQQQQEMMASPQYQEMMSSLGQQR
ncbi:Hypp5226 [Branchiostoma lanceolatum]|uniref:Hypp5226 protein n=1 Tax=Branchiostoma lanceolatum TaxID=7740 RepID=A0A8K0AG63_BRALA|nr:Hypp5226 [Branchiostoma lanceolatum]